MTPVIEALSAAYLGGFSTRSDFARSNAEAVAEAACRGWITTLNIVTGVFGRQWLVTPEGCSKLFREMNTMNEPKLVCS